MNIRNEFLEFFKAKGHSIYPAMPLVPDDNSLLFVNAGMVQFKDIFTDKIPASDLNIASCQTCIRAGGKHNDLENVGYTRRHHTFFEMLGNFSFGGYFKDKAIDYAFEFITSVLKIPKDKLWITVHNDDEESYELWQKYFDKDRIKKLGDKDNFWQMGNIGPCGPCSEIFYDQGEDNFNSDEDYLGGEGDRFLEIWNLVFMQFEKFKDGTQTPLKRPCVDTGMGLERVQAIIENKSSNFSSSSFMPTINAIAKLINKPYSYEDGASFRIIADHLRASIFLISNGVLFEKEGRGYVLRRILRRAVRHGFLLGFKKAFIYSLVDVVVDGFSDIYLEIKDNKEYIKEHIKAEEDRFYKTIVNGMNLFNKELKNTKQIFSGEIAFKLYDTYGFPLDLTQDMLRDVNMSVDIDKYTALMAHQKETARAYWKGSGDMQKSGDFKLLADKFSPNEFIGYQNTQCDVHILTLLDDDLMLVDKIDKNQTGWVLIKQTPFYAQSGGQEGDIGEIISTDKSIQLEVLDTRKFYDFILSKIKVSKNTLVSGDNFFAKVYNREDIARNHSATHLLQSVLKAMLGNSVGQAGSFNNNEKLRFDFTYQKALSKEQLLEVQIRVNEMILKGAKLITKDLPIEEAKKQGAIAMFGEKYGKRVRVVSFDKYSIEFCGGTHIDDISKIGSFYITKETSVSSGVRRIEAVTGKYALNYCQDKINFIDKTSEILKTKDIITAISALQTQVKTLKVELKNQNQTSTKIDTCIINDVLVGVSVSDGDIKDIIDNHKNQAERVALMLFSIKEDKVQIACGTKGVDIDASLWLKEISPLLEARGGGRKDFATGGGKNISNIKEATFKGLEYVKNLL